MSAFVKDLVDCVSTHAALLIDAYTSGNREGRLLFAMGNVDIILPADRKRRKSIAVRLSTIKTGKIMLIYHGIRSTINIIFQSSDIHMSVDLA